jgi:signal transduction histidine kinase
MAKILQTSEEFQKLLAASRSHAEKWFDLGQDGSGPAVSEILGERYVLVRASSLAVEFFDTVAGLYLPGDRPEAERIARQLLFDIAHSLGAQDARHLNQKLELDGAADRLAAGTIHFARAGWASVHVLPESSPTPDEAHYLICDHERSFEADAWLATGRIAEFPVCVMGAGYASGWCEASLDLELVSKEVMCRARGDAVCRFIVAPPSRIQEHVAAYLKRKPEVAGGVALSEVSGLFMSMKPAERAEKLDTALGPRSKSRDKQLLAAQEELVRREKLALLGQVADTVGHELRNPLGVINNAVYFLQSTSGAADEITKEYLQIIKDEVADADRIVSDLLDAVRIRKPDRQMVDLAQGVARSLRKSAIPESVELVVEIPDLLPVLWVDPRHLDRMLGNLITNAVEAMPEGGRLVIAAEAGPGTGQVTLSVTDTGAGMTQEQQAALFQPLFTTKARRIGLGLMVVKNLSRSNGGIVSATSEAGAGSRFLITLPVADPAIDPQGRAA